MHLPGRERERRERLLDRIEEAAHCGIDYVQLREKDMPSRDLEELASEAAKRVRAASGNTRLLINSRTDIALAASADGVHLRSKDVSPEDVRRIWSQAAGTVKPVIARSCHSIAEVAAAQESGSDFIVFSPVFEKKGSANTPAAGLEMLRAACRAQVPVLALGGISPRNAALCVQAGAKGIAGIRLFQEGNLVSSVAALRSQ